MRIEHKNRIVFFRALTLVIGLCTVLFLHRHFSARQPALVRINEISPWMNFSTVRVRGILASDARKLRSGSALYMVDDSSGVLPVFLTRSPLGKLPKAGCRVTIEGNLSIGAGHNLRMRTFSEDQVIVEAAILINKLDGDILLSDVTAEQEGECITVYGRVISVWNPKGESKAPYKIVLADTSGVLEVIHWFNPEERVAIGDVVQITGRVELYRGKVQVKVWESAGISAWSGR